MDTRYSTSPSDFKQYTTEQIRSEFLIESVFQAEEISVTYSHVDRMMILGVFPVKKTLRLSDFIDGKKIGTQSFLERRELGMINISNGTAIVEQDGITYTLQAREALYLTKEGGDVTFASQDANNPAKLYMLSTPAHRVCTNVLIKQDQVKKVPLGDVATANARVINQYLHPDVLDTCQLSMGLTELQLGSVWNTMPAHTHERRMEVYFYFDIPTDQAVFHYMGQAQETRHVVMQNEQAIISPSWSIHSGCGTSNYTFIWGMAGENQTFNDMDFIATPDLR